MLTWSERAAQLKAAPRVFTALIPALCAVHLAICFAMHDLRPEHLLTTVVVIGFSFWSDKSRLYARAILPFFLYAAVYDSMRWYEDYIRSPTIHIREPYDFDLRFFGIHTAAGTLTPNEWWQLHTSKALDFICGLSYTAPFFIGESILLSLYLVWQRQVARAERLVWVFFVSNVVGFSLYYLYPAAPPWYVSAHGFVADLSVRASAAGALRFDKLVGVPLMEGFYGKSADVFGAIPSLHVVYPFLSLVYGIHLPRFRRVAAAYFALVCFSAVYLNHHYLLDVGVGLFLATVTALSFRLLFGAVEPSRARQLVPAQDLASEI